MADSSLLQEMKELAVEKLDGVEPVEHGAVSVVFVIQDARIVYVEVHVKRGEKRIREENGNDIA